MQRAAVLYPDNTTTVDTGAPVDVRGLDETFVSDASATSVLNATQNTNVERTFDPVTAGAAATNNAATTNNQRGWAIPLAEMATVDAACVAHVAAQNVTVAMRCTATGTGTGDAGAQDVFTPRASLWKYDPATNAATLIVGASAAASSFSALTAYGPTTFSATAVVLAVPETTFTSDQVLMLVCGGNLACGPGLLGAARTFNVRLLHNSNLTSLTFATQGLVQACTASASLTGDGAASRAALPVTIGRDLVGAGVLSPSRLVTAAKTTDLVGAGVVSYTKATQAVRAFDLVGAGTIDGTITLPLDEVPTGSGVTVKRPLFLFDD